MTPYTLTIAPSDIDDLRRRLERTRWPAQLPGVDGWGKGVPVSAAKTWADELAAFDWRRLEQEVNALPQWTTEIDAATIHFFHVRSVRADAVPLLALHGWPGTAVELIDLVAPLTAPDRDDVPAFHVVVPSHPGTGLSGPVGDPGWGVPRTSRAYASLMSQLGYDSYVVHGGDHGAVLGPHVGRVDPEHVRGIHVNAASLGFMPFGDLDPATEAELSPTEKHRMQLIEGFLRDGNGYNVIQATRPQTIGYGLEDSPVAQLTWVVEKVEAWTHDAARLQDRHYRDRHLANVLVTWLTRTATSTADVVYAGYAELFADPGVAFADSGVPTGVIAYAEDPAMRRFAEDANSIVRWTDVDDGGHFAALEQPASLVADLREFVAGLD